MNFTNLFSNINPKEVIKNLPDAVFVADLDGRIVWANDKAAIIFESKAGDLKGLNFDEIVANGYVTNRPKLGITYSPASSSQMYSMIVSLKELPAGSLIVQSVQSDSSLASQDVKQGDLITKVNGKDLDSADDLPDLIDKSAVGDTLTLTICRIDSNYNINEFEVKATLVEDKGDSSSVKTESTTRSNSYNPFSAYGYGN